jgi:hypothetical protein
MRTFHIGGAASRQVEASESACPKAAPSSSATYAREEPRRQRRGREPRRRNRGSSNNDGGNAAFRGAPGGTLFSEDGQKVRKGSPVQWDPYNVSIVAEEPGR